MGDRDRPFGFTAEERAAEESGGPNLARANSPLGIDPNLLQPKPPRTGMPVSAGIGPVTPLPVSAEQQQRIKAAVAFHIGGRIPGIDWTSAVDPIANRFIQLAGSDPALIGSLENDVNTMFALTDMQIAERVMRGESVSQYGDVFDAIAEVSWEIGATELAARLNAERANTVKGSFDALTNPAEAQILSLTDVEDQRAALADPTGFVDMSSADLAKAQTFQTLFDVPGAWSFSPASGLLAVTVGEQTIGVTARPGFDPETHLDVMAEVVAAQQDGRVAGGELTGGQNALLEQITAKAHEVGAWVEANPQAREFVDSMWKGLAGGNLDVAREELEERREEIDEEAIRTASAIPFPEDAVIAMVAREIMAQRPGGESQDALALAAGIVDEDRQQFASEFESLTQKQLIEDLEQEVEGQSPLGAAVEESIQSTLDVFEWWDAFSQTIGVNFLDALGGIIDVSEARSWEEGVEALQRVITPAEPSEPTSQEFLGLPRITAADYFDLEGGWGDFANFSVGVGFDPLNLLLPGAKGIRLMARRGLTNPKFAQLYLRTGKINNVVTTIADESGPVALRNVASMSGLGADEIVDLARLALDPEATADQVREVLVRALSKDWLGEGPQRAIRHSTIEGLGRALESVAGGSLSPEAMDTILKLTAKLSVGRTFRIGENQVLDNFADLLVQFFPADKDKFAEWFLEAVNRYAAGNDPLALKGAAELQKEAARRSVWETGGSIRSINLGAGGDLRGVQQNLLAIEEALATLPSNMPASVADDLTRMHTIMSRRAGEASPRIAQQQAARRLAHKQLKKATYLENDVANAARNRMGALTYELYEDVAQQINTDFLEQFGEEVIPVMPHKINPLAPDVPVRDWSRITGVTQDFITDEDELALLMGLAIDDTTVARGLDAVGAFNRSQKVILPASPYEVIAFQKLARNESALQTWTKLIRGDFMKTVSGTIKRVFAANLLVNPLTAGKISLDETARFFADTGEFMKFLEASAVGLPGVGRGVETALRRLRTKYGDAISNPYVLAYRRNVGGWSADDFVDYGWVERPPRNVTSGFRLADYRETAERWLNGTLLQDRRFREYARWIDEATVLDDGTKVAPQGWIDWWENGDDVTRPGKLDTRHTTVTIRDTAVMGDELTAQQAFNIMDNAYNHWLLTLVDENQRNSLRRTLLEAARNTRGPLDVTADAHLLNAIKQVPGLQGGEGLTSRVFNVFFGGPSGRRAGVFYDHYFDEAVDILTERHAGRIITADDVLAAGAPDIETAQFWLKQGADNQVVSRLIANTGGVTEAHIAARAAVYAERRADDLMYRFTAASMVGRGVESALLFPFARAQVDFLSWWTDHMTKPLNLFGRLPASARVQLPGRIQDLMNTVDRIPINLRAWSRFAHIAATTNNDIDSPLDQMIDSLTFFPLNFDSEFFLDVAPQFGPLPSWLFDTMVDQGVISEEVEANFEALFPALGFTQIEGDFAEDIFNRLLPNSKRSLRDLTAGMLRSGYGFFGRDVFTEPGLMGTIANAIADNKVPAATGDFQAAAAFDFIDEAVWDVVPGSDEWNRTIAEISVGAAAEANRQEWGQDWKDRVFPLAEYDRQYRALRAYEVMFDDQIFGWLKGQGVLQINDLLEQDNGKPRIVDTWDRYKEGQATPDELEWLDDRLTGAYFEAGRQEIRPGFSFLDFLNLSSPGITVNLINKSEDSGIPVRSEDHADFKQRYVNKLTGRLQNVPPGDTGRELIADARRRGWIVSRPVEDWAFDAGAAVYKSGQRAVRGVWEAMTGRTWAAGTKKSIVNKKLTLGGVDALILNRAGLDVEAGTVFTVQEFHDLLDAFDERFDVAQPALIDTLARGTVHAQLARHNDRYGQGILDALDAAEKQYREAGIDSVEDWSEESKQAVRSAFNEAITLGYTTLADYEQEIEPVFGPLDYQPPVPPEVSELQSGLRLTGEELEDLEVIDGDTVSVLLADGPLRIRLLGINAPEVTQEGYDEARDNLAALVEDAEDVTFGVYEPETFGLTQLTAPGEQRLLMWLYVDGVPIFDPSVFTADNPRGAGVGGRVLDLEAILEAGR